MGNRDPIHRLEGHVYRCPAIPQPQVDLRFRYQDIRAGLGYAAIAILFILIPTFTGHGRPDWTMLLIGGGLFGLFGGIGSYFGRPPRIGGG